MNWHYKGNYFYAYFKIFLGLLGTQG